MKNPSIPPLQKGDSVSIVAPAGIVQKENIHRAKKILEDWGLEVKLGKFIFASSQVFAGIDQQRREDFQWALDDKTTKAILCARGGYGSIRIIDDLNFSHFIKQPKWIVGFSDISVFHSHLFRNFGLPSIHAVMPNSYSTDPDSVAMKSLHTSLFQTHFQYRFPTHPLSVGGEAKGILTGGNLSILYNLLGTNSDVDWKNKILFIEDVGEYYYHLDRMMQAFKRAGKLSQLKGLIAGKFSDMKEGNTAYQKSAEEIILESIQEYNYPVCFDFSAGHITNNLALRFGAESQLTVYQDYTEISL
jgi:muramoyltetrapeptide carboxypeptidase